MWICPFSSTVGTGTTIANSVGSPLKSLTMVNDFKGEPTEFAIVVPVPTVLEKGQIHIGDKALVDHLDAFSAPRLVEYFDPDPCPMAAEKAMDNLSAGGVYKMSTSLQVMRERAAGVTIEARYTIGEYDILI